MKKIPLEDQVRATVRKIKEGEFRRDSDAQMVRDVVTSLDPVDLGSPEGKRIVTALVAQVRKDTLLAIKLAASLGLQSMDTACIDEKGWLLSCLHS